MKRCVLSLGRNIGRKDEFRVSGGSELQSRGPMIEKALLPIDDLTYRMERTSESKDLRVIINSELTMIPHVNKLVTSCYFHIRQLHVIRRSLTIDAAHALAQSLVHSRLDYCNSVLVGLPEYMINRLQSVLRSAACLKIILNYYLIFLKKKWCYLLNNPDVLGVGPFIDNFQPIASFVS